MSKYVSARSGGHSDFCALGGEQKLVFDNGDEKLSFGEATTLSIDEIDDSNTICAIFFCKKKEGAMCICGEESRGNTKRK